MRVGAVIAILLLSGCAMDELADGAPGHDGIVELVEARVQSLEGPSLSFAGEAPALTAHGVHADACTRFDRFETQVMAGASATLLPWATQPLGGCTAAAVPFSATATLAGLSPGRHRIALSSGDVAREVTVLSAQEAACDAAVSLPIDTIWAPPPTHPGGRAEVRVRVVLPTLCHGPPSVERVETAGGFDFTAHARVCGPVGDATACPAYGKTVAISSVLEGLPVGGHDLDGPDVRTADRLEVVETSRCTFEPLVVESARVPPLAAEDAPPRLVVAGRLPSTCAAIDPATWTLSDGIVEVSVPVRTCESALAAETCLEATGRVETEVVLEGLEPGHWGVSVNGHVLSRRVTVGPAGICERRALPAGAVASVLATSGLYADLRGERGAAGAPVDVHAVGELPDGCWMSPRLVLTGGIGAGTIALTTEATFCDMACDLSEEGEPDPLAHHVGADPDEGDDPPDDGETEAPAIAVGVGGERGFSATLSIPGGLSAGTWTVTVDGEDGVRFTVE